MRNRARLGSAAMAIAALLALASPAAWADQQISTPGEGAGQTSAPQGVAVDTETGRLFVADAGNNRVSVFDSEGDFELAFGWGVADGSAELQSCGPGATPSTASCQKGLAGGGAGQFSAMGGIAVDNDPGSASHHDVYVLDGARVQKFDPDGNFLLTWGGGVISSGSTGVGDLSAGSPLVTAARTTSREFGVGQAITGAGIPAGTRITAIGKGTITLSQPASATATGVVLTVPEGAGNVRVNERVQLETNVHTLTIRFIFSTPGPDSVTAEGEFIDVTKGLTAKMIQDGLVALSNIGPGDVVVTGSGFGPYTIEFTGALADTDVETLRIGGAGGVEFEVLRNGHSAAQVCTQAIAESCAAGVDGVDPTVAGQLAGTPWRMALATGSGGLVYVADSIEVDFGTFGGVFENRLQRFDETGAPVDLFPLPETDSFLNGLAVESTGGFLVSTNDSTIRRYEPNGALAETRSVKSVFELGIDGDDQLVAVETDDVYRVIAQYLPSGEATRRFGYGNLKTFIEDIVPYSSPSGDVIVSEGDVVRHLSFPPPGPIVAPDVCKANPIGNTKATLRAKVNPEGKSTTVHFEYVDRQSFETEGGYASPNTVVTPESAPIGDGTRLEDVSAEVDVTPETDYHCRVIATDSEANDATGPDGTFKTLPPFEVVATWASGVGLEVATLSAAVKPFGIPATGLFEYVDEASFQQSGFAQAKRVPAAGEELDFGADPTQAKEASAQIAGLLPASRYRYRVVVADSFFPAGIPGPTKTLRTFSSEREAPGGRAYELVSPIEKNGADVGAFSAVSGLAESAEEKARITAASPSGEAVTYTSFISFGEDAESAPPASQYLSKRGPSGWGTENVNLAGTVKNALRPPYMGFTPDLGFGAAVIDEPALFEGAAGTQNLYLRDSASGAVHTITTSAPQVSGGETFCAGFAGATPDGKHVIFAANGALAGAPKAKGFSLYEWTAGLGLALVSVMPEGTPVAPGDHGFGQSARNCSVGDKVVRNAISADGQRIFWTFAKGEDRRLMARVSRTQTLQLDKAEAGAPGSSGGGMYWAASTDGSRVLFTSPNRLVEGASEGAPQGIGDLYRYDFQAPEGARLTDLTPASLTEGEEAADVLGVVGASTDGSAVYFVANGVLAEGASLGKCAPQGNAETPTCNLYLYREGEGVRFVARLSGKDQGAWIFRPKEQSARVSPSGRHLAFLSTESLTGHDNTRQGGGSCQLVRFDVERNLQGDSACAQAFVYDADADGGAGELVCASCNPSGQRPVGPTILPTWSNPYSQPRYLSDDGSRLFFETIDPLAPHDVNGRYDVYELARAGVSGCDEESPSYVLDADGCAYLISSGQSPEDSYLLDASADGRDVFLSTRERLLPGRDRDERYDVYDFRAGGGFPETPLPPACEGEGCRGPATEPAAAAVAGTAAFAGPGNLVEAGPQSCAEATRRAKRLADRADRLRRQAGLAQRKSQPGRAAGLSRSARRVSRLVRKQRGGAKRCLRRARAAQGASR